MKIIFDKRFYESDYANDANDGAAVPGRLEAIMSVIETQSDFAVVTPQPASDDDILRAHSQAYLDTVRVNTKRYDMAILAAGAAIAAAEHGMNGTPAFACARPPGHHAARDSSWGFCVFGNMAIALLRLRAAGRINSAFILDFDAHTGDGTKALLADWKGCRILNPYAETAKLYLEEIENTIRDVGSVDIVAVCAGFDSYEKDLGRRLSTDDFYTIGWIMKKFAHRAANGRRFAVLEGGYYLPDLGKNVLTFCRGFR